MEDVLDKLRHDELAVNGELINALFEGLDALKAIFFFSSRRRHTRWPRDWSSDVCSSDLCACARREQRTDPRGDPRCAARGPRSMSVTASAARRLARFVVALEPKDLPAAVAEKASLLALDILGCCLAATRYDFGRAVRTTAERLGGTPESTVVGGALRVAAANAVLANATLAHGLDFDDTREDAIVHTGCVAVPTSLAVGEATGASGRAALAAIVAAVEVMCRVGLAVPGKFHARHYHPTALAGTFAAAAAAGKLYGLTEDELVRAFGICGSQAAGIIEYLADGSWTKRLHPGWAAHAGVVA